jgi:hypothetical protein
MGDDVEKRLLTPAEAGLLLDPGTDVASRCIQAGLLSLLDAGRIEFEPSSNPFKQSALRLSSGSRASNPPLPGHLEALERALVDYGKGDRLVSTQVVHALQKRFGYGYARYVHDELAPGLIKRDLLTRENYIWLWLFTRVRYRRTARGDALARPLERLMAAVEDLPSLIAADPERAVRLARSAGVLLIMSPKARKQIPKLRKLLAKRGDDAAALAYLPLETDSEPEWDQVLELGDMALAFDMDGMFEMIDAVGDFTSDGDGGSSDGGDGGGGGD